MAGTNPDWIHFRGRVGHGMAGASARQLPGDDVMEDLFSRIIENLVGRVHGPLTFRLVLQPVMASFFAIRDGRRDARDGKTPYFWSLLSSPEHRREMLQDGWKSVGQVFVLAVAIDAVYQFIQLRWLYPVEAFLVACLLALVPYLLLRGLATRLTRRSG